MKQLRFLGWDAPLPRLAAPALLNTGYRAEPGNSIDLSGVLVLIPGRHAIRILNETMTALLEPLSAGLFPPEFYTPERFVSEGASRFSAASEADIVHAWKQVISKCGAGEFPILFPKEFADCGETVATHLAGQFIQLKRELSAGGHSIAELMRTGVSVDSGRWREIQELENRVALLLAEHHLADPEDLKLKLADSVAEFRKFERIVVIGMPDLSALLLKRLAKVAETMEVEIWVNAPEALQNLFDGWGRPVPELWTDYPVSFGSVAEGRAEIYKTETVEQMASAAAALLLESGRELNGKILAVGGEALFNPLSRELAGLTAPDGSSLEVVNPSGEPVRGLRLFDLLNGLHGFLTDSRFEAAEALIRHPDVLRYFAKVLELPENLLLTRLDQFRIRHLPDLFDVVFQTAGPEIRPLFERLRDLRENYRRKPLAEVIREWLAMIYADHTPSPSHGIPFRSEVAELESVLLQIRRSPLYRDVPLSESFGDLLELFGSRRLYRQRGEHDFSIGGFLELPWSEAREIVLCGMNDGMIPENVRGSTFLSDSQRSFLGLPNNARRTARDLLYLESVLNSRPRGAVRFLASRFDSENKPQKFSRFFFQGERGDVLERAALLYDPVRMPDPPSGNNAGARFVLQPDYSASGTEPTVSVTRFKDYLASPFRFFLKTKLKMDSVDFEPKEMDRAGFGSCCHAALERAGRDRITDPDRMKERLFEELDCYMRECYGSPLPVLLAIQNEQIKQRLAWTAGELAGAAREFEPLELEYPLGGEAGGVSFAGLKIRGRIDRIEYSASQNLLRLIDYKTIDDGSSPEAVHWNGRSRRFTDLQLPLYRMLILRDPAFRAKHPEIDFATVRILCGYLSMPKSVTDTKYQFWEGLDMLLPAAEELVERIAAELREMTDGIFHEDPEKRVKYDLFEPFFLPDLRSAVPSAVWKTEQEERR